MGSMLQVERLGNVKGQSVLCLKGPLTVESISLFQNAIRREESFSTVILDLSDVPYIDSTALGALVAAHRDEPRRVNVLYYISLPNL